MLHCFLSAIAGGAAVCIPWYVVARIWDRNRTYLLSENCKLRSRIDRLTLDKSIMISRALFAEAKLRPFLVSRENRDPVTKQFRAKVAA